MLTNALVVIFSPLLHVSCDILRSCNVASGPGSANGSLFVAELLQISVAMAAVVRGAIGANEERRATLGIDFPFDWPLRHLEHLHCCLILSTRREKIGSELYIRITSLYERRSAAAIMILPSTAETGNDRIILEVGTFHAKPTYEIARPE